MRVLLLIWLFAVAAAAQTPPIEPGVSQELAKWRAARYSDIRYKLNLTLEKMSPVLKGTIEIRVKLSSPPYEGGVDAGLGGRGGSLLILDWRKINGHENSSTISNVTVNGRVASLTKNHPVAPIENIGTPSLLRKEGSLLYEETNEHLVFRDGVVLGENVIKLDFTSPILTSGSAITRYIDKEDGSEYIYSLFVPSDASTAFPVFDQPDLKATFYLEADVPKDLKVISNSQAMFSAAKIIGYSAHDEYGHPPIPADLYRYSFFPTKPISTYVFAFAAGPFEKFTDAGAGGGNPSRSEGVQRSKSGTSDTLPTGRVSALGPGGSIYVRRSQAQKFKPHSAEVFRLNSEAVKYFEQYFDYKFPFPKYDLVLIPEFPFGGMEHAGATFLRESSIIFPQEPTKGDYISRSTLIFHEAAHQWFGDTVTMRWFDDLWLKEGFATFMAYKALEKITPDANAWKVFYERVKQAAYHTDATKGTTAIYQPIANLSAAKSAYGNIVYNKAPAFLRQAEFYLGEDKFQTAVRAFLKKNEFANAGWEDLVKEFEGASGQKLENWATAWVKRPGAPIVRINKVFDPDATRTFIRLETPTFQNDRNKESSVHIGVNILKVLIAKGTREETRQVSRVMLTEQKQEIDLSGTMIASMPDMIGLFPNYQDYGYGIFLLDDKSRDYVLKNIQNEEDPFLRSMMWGALWDSVREGELDPRVYVELVIKQLGGEVAEARASARAIANRSLTETDETIVASLVGRVSLALNYYLPAPDIALANARASATSDLRSRFEAVLLERMRLAAIVGEKQTFFRAFVANATTQKSQADLKAMLREGGNPSSSEGVQRNTSVTSGTLPTGRVSASAPAIVLRTKDKFDIVTRLAILGDADAPKLLADLEKTETSDDAKRYAYAAKAGIPTAENKGKYWDDFVNNKTISESWIEAAFGPWNSIRHSELTLPFLERALKELPNHKRSRKIFFVNGWLAAFIGGQRDERALAIINKFLADNPSLDNDLRLKILENMDLIERAVKVRNKYKN